MIGTVNYFQTYTAKMDRVAKVYMFDERTKNKRTMALAKVQRKENIMYLDIYKKQISKQTTTMKCAAI